MSWIEASKDKLIIRTGDGREFSPLWREPKKVIEYNVSQFEFPSITGSIVHRGTRKGRKFSLEIYFQGDDHLDQSEIFETSANDPRHWVMTHPYYGIINAQPSVIDIDNTQGNVSKFAISLIETIVDENPKGQETPTDKIIELTVNTADLTNVYMSGNIPSPSTLDKISMQKNVDAIYKEGRNRILNADDLNNYLNQYNTTTNDILSATDDVFQAMVSIQATIEAPFQFVDTVKNRINMLRNQFLKIVTSGVAIADLLTRKNDKRLYEHNAGLIVNTMTKAAVTSIDYKSAEDVLSATSVILNTYEEFITNLDALQTANAGGEDSYAPDADVMIKLNDVVNYTVSRLLEIAVDSKQERSIITEIDTNIILLAHRLYGLQPDDSTIDYLIETNRLGLEDLIQVQAGRQIKYYV